MDASIKNGRIGRLQSRMVLQGDYQSFRRFIYELESSPEFLIIDSVTLTQSDRGETAPRDARSVDLLPHQDQWQLTARARCFSVGLALALAFFVYRWWASPSDAALLVV